MSNNVIISIFLAVCISLTYLFKEKDNFVFRQLVSAFGYYYRYQKLTFREHFIQGFTFFIGVIGFSLLLSQYFQPYTFSFSTFLIFCAAILGYVFVKMLCMRMYFSCFYDKRANNILNQHIRLLGIAGIISFVCFIFLKFTPEITHVIWYAITLLSYILISLSYCYLLFKYFFNRIELTLHFILYLCTLEILPLLVAYKAAGEMVIFTN